jgi:cytochrome c553
MSAMLGPISVEAEPKAVPAVATVCAPCHGLDGIGHDVEVPNIQGNTASIFASSFWRSKVADVSTQRCTLSDGT